MNNETRQEKAINQSRRIIHIDMDAFFAAIEQRDFPELAGKPVVVGGRPNTRGVVATCSYEARQFGIGSAMPSARAARLCRDAIFIKPRFGVYRSVSQQLREVFFEFTDLVEMVSLDEAYLDVSETTDNIAAACDVARTIKRKVKDTTQLTSSAGVANNKFLAKIASDRNKPDGLFAIFPEQVNEFIAALPVRLFYGVGRVTAAKMEALNIKTGKDLKQHTVDELIDLFGKAGIYYYHAVRGRDDRQVVVNRTRKSIGSEKTFQSDLWNKEQAIMEANAQARNVAQTLVERGLSARTVTLKVKYSDFNQITRSHTFAHPLSGFREMLMSISTLIEKTEIGSRPVRLLGVSVSNLCSSKTARQSTFEFSG